MQSGMRTVASDPQLSKDPPDALPVVLGRTREHPRALPPRRDAHPIPQDARAHWTPWTPCPHYPSMNAFVAGRFALGTAFTVAGASLGALAGVVGRLPLQGAYLYRWFARPSLALADLGRRLGTPTIEQLRRLDPRPPVLYLRAFSIDASDVDEAADTPWGRVMTLRDEEVLTEALRGVGPVFAVGEPGTSLPLPGASRMTLEDHAWQARVRKLMDDSALVVLRIGFSEGVLWEVETAVATVPPERLLLFCPRYLSGSRLDARFGDFRERTASIFPAPLPSTLMGCRFLGFEADWTPRPHGPLQSGKVIQSLIRKPEAVAQLHAALTPWMTREGHEVPETVLFSHLSAARLALTVAPAILSGVHGWNLHALGRPGLAATLAAGVALHVALLALLLQLPVAGRVSVGLALAVLFAGWIRASWPRATAEAHLHGARAPSGWVESGLLAAGLLTWWVPLLSW